MQTYHIQDNNLIILPITTKQTDLTNQIKQEIIKTEEMDSIDDLTLANPTTITIPLSNQKITIIQWDQATTIIIEPT